MTKRKECDCRNVSNCMLSAGADPLKMTYFDGTLIYRTLRLEEVGRDPKPGDAVSKHPTGKLFVTAVALDPSGPLRSLRGATGASAKLIDLRGAD